MRCAVTLIFFLHVLDHRIHGRLHPVWQLFLAVLVRWMILDLRDSERVITFKY
jgi:hypothetical protein